MRFALLSLALLLASACAHAPASESAPVDEIGERFQILALKFDWCTDVVAEGEECHQVESIRDHADWILGQMNQFDPPDQAEFAHEMAQLRKIIDWADRQSEVE